MKPALTTYYCHTAALSSHDDSPTWGKPHCRVYLVDDVDALLRQREEQWDRKEALYTALLARWKETPA